MDAYRHKKHLLDIIGVLMSAKLGENLLLTTRRKFQFQNQTRLSKQAEFRDENCAKVVLFLSWSHSGRIVVSSLAVDELELTGNCCIGIDHEDPY